MTDEECERKITDLASATVVKGPDGNAVEVCGNISPQHAIALYRMVRGTKPTTVIEVGMAYATSTLCILLALRQNGRGTCLSIDPYEHWDGGLAVALHRIDNEGLSGLHRHERTYSHLALGHLEMQRQTVDFIYLDGHHGLDYVLVDAFLSDRLLVPGGILGFNDCGWKSVHKVRRFIERWRDYSEVDAGLKPDYRAKNFIRSLVRRLEGRDGRDRYYRKVRDWQPHDDGAIVTRL